MKKVILFILIFVAASRADAFLIVDVDYTGIIKERIDTCGYGCGNVSITSFTSNLLSAGGPVSNNSVGYAQQFTISEQKNMDYLLVSAHIAGDQVPDGQIAYNDLFLKLYTNTSTVFHGEPSLPYPDVYSLALVSHMSLETSTYDVYYPELDIVHTFNLDGTYIDFLVPFDITLEPGNYWVAQERYPGNDFTGGGGGAKVDSISVKFAQSNVVPEPASIFLLGTGLLGAFFRRKFLES